MKIIVLGAAGRMGRVLIEQIHKSSAYELAAAVDCSRAEGTISELPLYTGEADCIIDFSHHSATALMLDYAVFRQIPLVIATTGQTDQEKRMIENAAKSTPIFFSSNMSLAVALLAELAARAVSLFPEADIEIIERHHNRKQDVPSGTALMLGEAICGVRPGSKLVVGRHENGRRSPNDIGIHSLRLGNEVGTHEIIIATDTQTITLAHHAQDRSLFAEGALKAADFVVGKCNGLYGMQDLLSQGGKE